MCTFFVGGDVCVSGHDSGPVFEEQPYSLIYPEGMPEGKVTLSCQARASPAAIYRYSDQIFVTYTLLNKTGPLLTVLSMTCPLTDIVESICTKIKYLKNRNILKTKYDYFWKINTLQLKHLLCL